ncbi:fungal protein [Schizosaccharomyces japonicus yFS275]|uniref:Fungal protein n=1 Tax=Schizosaccharomyces japonicus (strain yFS275 / FY16936) TaxID=402676 RepID=B6K8C6_SCHJY|nr:fungal protein [Schizosaccharomyces japonicus yFS275]EEB09780.2 fungal protein [Schizosaccharomyces japonicus yFS275]
MQVFEQEQIDVVKAEKLIVECAKRLELLDSNLKLDLELLTCPSNRVNAWETRGFLRDYYTGNQSEGRPWNADELKKRVTLLSTEGLISVTKWLFYRIPGGVVSWRCYRLFEEADSYAKHPMDGFTIFMKLAARNNSHFNVIQGFVRLLASMAARLPSESVPKKSTSLEVIAQLSSCWAFSWPCMDLEDGLAYWNKCTNACLRLLLAYLRGTDKRDEHSFSLLPMSLQTQLRNHSYPPVAKNFNTESYRVINIMTNQGPQPTSPLEVVDIISKMQLPSHVRSSFPIGRDRLHSECLLLLKRMSRTNSSQIAFNAQESAWLGFLENGFDRPIASSVANNELRLFVNNDMIAEEPSPLIQYPTLEQSLVSQYDFSEAFEVNCSSTIKWLWLESKAPEIPELRRSIFSTVTVLMDANGSICLVQQIDKPSTGGTRSTRKGKKRNLLNRIRSSIKRVIKANKFSSKKSMPVINRKSCTSILFESNRAAIMHVAERLNVLNGRREMENSLKAMKLTNNRDPSWDPDTAEYVNSMMVWVGSDKHGSTNSKDPLVLLHPENSCQSRTLTENGKSLSSSSPTVNSSTEGDSSIPSDDTYKDASISITSITQEEEKQNELVISTEIQPSLKPEKKIVLEALTIPRPIRRPLIPVDEMQAADSETTIQQSASSSVFSTTDSMPSTPLSQTVNIQNTLSNMRSLRNVSKTTAHSCYTPLSASSVCLDNLTPISSSSKRSSQFSLEKMIRS